MNRNPYSNGKIYRISNLSGDGLTYYGATTRTIDDRYKQHLSSYNRWKNGEKSYLTSFIIFEKYGKENTGLFLVEEFPCSTKKELETRERYYIQKDPCVNKTIPTRTVKEYVVDNKDKILTAQRKYTATHRPQERARFKRFYQQNREAIIHKNTQYNQAHRDIILARNKIKQTCPTCQRVVNKYYFNKHLQQHSQEE